MFNPVLAAYCDKAANGQGNITGDAVYSSTHTVPEDEGMFIAFDKQDVEIACYPNPATRQLYLGDTNPDAVFGDYSIYSTRGELVMRGTAQRSISVERLAPGSYVLHLDKGPVFRFNKVETR